jgi:hypothetical protein
MEWIEDQKRRTKKVMAAQKTYQMAVTTVTSIKVSVITTTYNLSNLREVNLNKIRVIPLKNKTADLLVTLDNREVIPKVIKNNAEDTDDKEESNEDNEEMAVIGDEKESLIFLTIQ